MPGDEVCYVVLGDSIMWGQGLPEDEKFTALVADHIQGRYGKRARMVARYAHSGAIVGGSGAGDASPTDASGDFRGEVPSSHPSIRAQLAAAGADRRVEPDRIDLVLVDGGMNDGAFGLVINPYAGPDALREAAQLGCETRMGELLKEVLATFPNARVVVTGYYPVFSQLSRASHVGIFVGLLLSARGIRLAREVSLATLVRLSKIWAEESERGLRAAVEAANAGEPVPRVAHAPVRFSDNRCLFAPGSWLWGFGSLPPLPGDDNFGLDDVFNWLLTLSLQTAWFRAVSAADPVRHDRKPECKARFDAGDLNRYACNLASVGHPNRHGARQYCGAIVAALDSLWQVQATFDEKLFITCAAAGGPR